jgi:hypothetical protein
MLLNLKTFIMKQTTILFFCTLLWVQTLKSQNADNLYLNAASSGFDYQAASFVIDSALPSYQFTRGLLLWAANTGTTASRRALSLDEIDSLGTPVAQRLNIQAGLPYKSLQPKVIIRSQFGKYYYLLAHVISSPNLINGRQVSSSAYVLKLDDNLNLVWSSKIHFATIDNTTSQALIEYNNLTETRDGNIVLVGRYAAAANRPQALQLAKLNQANGQNIWWFWYYLWNCNANGLSVEEATDGELVVTGYTEQCTNPVFAGYRQMLFGRVSRLGAPIQFRKFFNRPGEDVSGDKINRFLISTDANGNSIERFFITGFTLVNGATPDQPGLGRQNLVADITQTGDILNAAHWGDSRDEEANDHIFARIEIPNTNLFELNVVGNTNSYGAPQAHISVLEYNANTFVFNLRRFDIIKNSYPNGQVYSSRRAHEIKYAGRRQFAILLNSTRAVGSPVYNQQVTNVFIRDYAVNPEDFTCYDPKQPPITAIKFLYKDTLAVLQTPPYRIYNELWIAGTPISKKLDCGPIWRIYPRLAARRTIRIGGQYRGPGDIVPQFLRVGSVQQIPEAGGTLYPNPANTEVNLLVEKEMLKRGTPIFANVYTADMRLVRSANVNGKGLLRISLEGMLPGMYILQLQQEGKRLTYRFIKN